MFGAQNSESLICRTPEKYAFAWRDNGLCGIVTEKTGEAIVVDVAVRLAIARRYACQVR